MTTVGLLSHFLTHWLARPVGESCAVSQPRWFSDRWTGGGSSGPRGCCATNIPPMQRGEKAFELTSFIAVALAFCIWTKGGEKEMSRICCWLFVCVQLRLCWKEEEGNVHSLAAVKHHINISHSTAILFITAHIRILW